VGVDVKEVESETHKRPKIKSRWLRKNPIFNYMNFNVLNLGLYCPKRCMENNFTIFDIVKKFIKFIFLKYIKSTM